jgi:hypothetical protein
MKPRAARVTAPGAQRLELKGVLASSDDFGRLRLLILAEGRDGAPDYTWRVLSAALPRTHGHDPPYVAGSDGKRPDADGVWATATITLPARRKKFWLELAGVLRGQWVTAEVTMRPYKRGESRGTALDLSLLRALADSAAPARKI